MKLVQKKLRVCHLPQIPCKPFIVEVNNEREAYLLEQAFADQHCFLFDNKMIPDYSNVITVEMWDDDLDADENGEKWTDYYNEEEFMEWAEFTETYADYVKGAIENVFKK